MNKIVYIIISIVATTALMAKVDTTECAGCHGTDWSKVALRKSKVVSEMSQADIVTALKGYKANTRGRPMNRMHSQVYKYSDTELETIALCATTPLVTKVDTTECAGCHGTDWSKVALRKSKVVSEMSHEDITTALKGYKANTRGRPMNRMHSQVYKYTDAELEAIAQSIGK